MCWVIFTTLAFNDYKTVFFKRVDVKKLADIVYSNRFKDFGKAILYKIMEDYKINTIFSSMEYFQKINF